MIKSGALYIPDGDTFFAKRFERTGNKFDFGGLQAAASTARKGVAVDVGAHVGSWTVHMARWFREVVSFEPDEQNYQCLIENTKELHNVLCCHGGLGDVKRSAALKRHEGGNTGCMRIVDGADFQVTRLDDFGLTELDLLKIDVEGYEGRVIAGAMDIIGLCRPVVVYENNGLGPKLFKDWVDPAPLMKSLGYKMVKKVQHDEVWQC